MIQKYTLIKVQIFSNELALQGLNKKMSWQSETELFEPPVKHLAECLSLGVSMHCLIQCENVELDETSPAPSRHHIPPYQAPPLPQCLLFLLSSLPV